jgi:hypothetical protein
MIQKLGIEETEASQMNGVLYKSYGTSMAGLKVCRPWKKKTKSSWQTFYQNPTDLLMSCDFFPLSRPLVMILTMMTTTGTELNIPTYSFSFFF